MESKPMKTTEFVSEQFNEFRNLRKQLYNMLTDPKVKEKVDYSGYCHLMDTYRKLVEVQHYYLIDLGGEEINIPTHKI